MGEDLRPLPADSPVHEENGHGEKREHKFFASWYPKVAAKMDRHGLAEHRRTLLHGLTGEVVEIGPGHGPNFALYPPEVTRVLAVEPEPHLRELAVATAAGVAAAIEVVPGSAERVPAEDASFDAAVVSLVLCSVGDQVAALREVRRVLRPGGQLRFLEHVRSASRPSAVVQQVLDATRLWPAVAGGCRCSRDTAAAIGQAGFDIDESERFLFPAGGRPTPTRPHLRGTAHR